MKTLKGTGAIVATAMLAFSAGELEAHDRHQPNPGVVAGSGLPSVLPGIGTYAGDVSALRIRGNGIYFMVGHSTYRPVPLRLAPKALIIDVNAKVTADNKSLESACRYEAGVCVIRP
ncbi:hypothetical protein [Ciceribacter thiooxidans]|uniref:Uncharacterized protein n=1 Tax=Ciceribacter thiooxidans TaxID=1969821 RepID=A0ABV7HU19_9HYPH|nr:hypothetical protein [Ciceribacter thiooxidans]